MPTLSKERISTLGDRRVAPNDGCALEDHDAVLIGDHRREIGDRLVISYRGDLHLGRDLVTGPDRRPEAPVDVQEHTAGPGQVLGYHRVEQAAGNPALHDDPPEARPAGQQRVVVRGVAVAGELGEQLDVAGRYLPSPARCVAYLHVEPPRSPARWYAASVVLTTENAYEWLEGVTECKRRRSTGGWRRTSPPGRAMTPARSRHSSRRTSRTDTTRTTIRLRVATRWWQAGWATVARPTRPAVTSQV